MHLDDDYDGRQFIVRGMYFCGGDKNEFSQWRKGLANVAPKSSAKTKQTLSLEFNEELWQRLYDFRSGPIERKPGRCVAVRVVSQFGEESSKVLAIQ